MLKMTNAKFSMRSVGITHVAYRIRANSSMHPCTASIKAFVWEDLLRERVAGIRVREERLIAAGQLLKAVNNPRLVIPCGPLLPSAPPPPRAWQET